MSMTAELRWALLIIGSVFLGALIWWERRRPRQARGTPERLLRETPEPLARGARVPFTDLPTRPVRESLTLPEVRVHEIPADAELPELEVADADSVPVLEPSSEVEQVAELSIEPLDEVRYEADPYEAPPEAESLPAPDDDAALIAQPPASRAAPADTAAPLADEPAYSSFAEPPREPESPSPPAAEEWQPRREPPPAAQHGALPREDLPELPAGPAPRVEWPPDAQRRILALRLVAPQANRFAGRSLRQALAAEGFVLGQFAIFHKPDDEHRAMLSAASLTRPGTFDMDTMDSQHYGGLSLFAVLPGPKDPPQAFDELVFTARSLNERLHGVLQDEQGTPLTPARVAHLREQLRAAS